MGFACIKNSFQNYVEYFAVFFSYSEIKQFFEKKKNRETNKKKKRFGCMGDRTPGLYNANVALYH